MITAERSSLILAFARVLFVNGQSTEQTLAAVQRPGKALGLDATILPRWGELQLQTRDENGALSMTVEALPTNVHMSRVSYAMRALEDLGDGRLAPEAASEAIAKISRTPAPHGYSLSDRRQARWRWR
jgi:uncharacterized membrane protein YjjP (DUF1212 family)